MTNVTGSVNEEWWEGDCNGERGKFRSFHVVEDPGEAGDDRGTGTGPIMDTSGALAASLAIASGASSLLATMVGAGLPRDIEDAFGFTVATRAMRIMIGGGVNETFDPAHAMPASAVVSALKALNSSGFALAARDSSSADVHAFTTKSTKGVGGTVLELAVLHPDRAPAVYLARLPCIDAGAVSPVSGLTAIGVSAMAGRTSTIDGLLSIRHDAIAEALHHRRYDVVDALARGELGISAAPTTTSGVPLPTRLARTGKFDALNLLADHGVSLSSSLVAIAKIPDGVMSAEHCISREFEAVKLLPEGA